MGEGEAIRQSGGAQWLISFHLEPYSINPYLYAVIQQISPGIVVDQRRVL